MSHTVPACAYHSTSYPSAAEASEAACCMKRIDESALSSPKALTSQTWTRKRFISWKGPRVRGFKGSGVQRSRRSRVRRFPLEPSDPEPSNPSPDSLPYPLRMRGEVLGDVFLMC